MNHEISSIKTWPKDDRPREKLIAKGPSQLSDTELLSLILRTGNRRNLNVIELARELLLKSGGFRPLSVISIKELLKIDGIGITKAAALVACLEIARRFASERIPEGKRYESSLDVYQHFHEVLRHEKKEHFLALLLDGKNRLIKETLISEGSLTCSIVHPREVFLSAIKESAASLILVHNHPSGDPSPSKEDIEITIRLKAAGELLGLHIIDHVIIGNGNFLSLREKGIF